MAKKETPITQSTTNCVLSVLLFIGFFSSSFSFFKFRTLRLSEKGQISKQNYYTVAEWLGFVPPIIMCIALVITCMVPKEKGTRKVLLINNSSYSKSYNVVKDYMNMEFLIGVARVGALLMACFQSCQIGIISEKSSATGFYAVLGLLIASFCLAEYMSMLDELGVMPDAVETDLGFFKFTIASSLCAVQYVYGSGKYMAITYILSMILNLMQGSITSSQGINQNPTTSTNNDDTPPSIEP